MAHAKSKGVKSKFSEFISDIKENVTEGTRVLSELSTELLEEAKEKAEDLYEAGYEQFEKASGVVQDYADRYKGNREIKKLSDEKIKLTASLGDTVFHEFKKNGTVTKRFLTTNKLSALISKIEKLDKEILKIGKELDKKK